MADSSFSNRPALPLYTRPHQYGMTLIMLVFLLGLAGTAFIITAMNARNLRLEQDRISVQTLTQAKSLLIGYATGYIAGAQRPGDLIRPDYFASTESPFDYDGTAETGCMDASAANGLPLIASGQNMRCLGRFPWKNLGMQIDSPSEEDAEGRMPWYAVSANLVDPTCLTALHPEILNLSYTGYTCAGGSLPHPWLTVRDKYGNILSNRVAAVLIIPGPPIGTQSRSASPNLSDVTQYLDTVTVDAGCSAITTCVPGTYSNAGLSNEFILGIDGRLVDSCDPIFHGADCATVYNFNDKLVYITIDDLMAEVVKRAAGEARAVLNSYKSKTGSFPYAASLGAGNYTSINGLYQGILPIDTTDTCSCPTLSTSVSSCSCSFKLVGSITFKRSGSSTWSATNISGACTRSTTQKCTCTGAGYCKTTTGTRNFTCDSTGNCSSNTSGTYTFTPPTFGTFYSASSGCGISGANIDCDATASYSGATFSIDGLNEAAWFKDNLWQESFFYHWAPAADLQAGSTTGIAAIIIGAGQRIISAPFASSKSGTAQVRPSGNLNDYLDSIENTDGNNLYDPTQTTRTSSYNDQLFIVAP